jgi:PAS domain S-box-containing protein
MLEGEGYEVEPAHDAKSGLESVHANPPDIVLVDLALSPIPAWKVIREIKADPALRALPVLAIATATQGAERQRALAAGCDGFLGKPLEAEPLGRVLASYLGDDTRPLPVTTPTVRAPGRARILLGSSDPQIVTFCTSSLEQRAFHVEAASSGAEVLRRISEAPFDLVVLDRSLADQPGERIAAQIRGAHRDPLLPVLLLVEEGFAVGAASEGWADDFLRKPVPEEVLFIRIRTLLHLRRALDAEKQRTGELATIVRQMRSGAILFDEEGRITLMNRQAADLLGLPPGGLEGRSARHLFRESRLRDSAGGPLSFNLNPVATLRHSAGPPVTLKEIYLRESNAGGPIRIEATFSRILDDRGRLLGFSMVLRPLSEDSQAQRELLEAYEHLMEVDQLKSKFLSTVSHELRTPLNTIILLSHLLATEAPDARPQEQRTHDLEILRQSGTALLHMINNLLDLARLEAGEVQIRPETFDLRPFLEETLEMMLAQAETKGPEVALKILYGTPVRASLDREKLRQVLINLLSNAMKFTREGHVTLEAGPSPSQASLAFVVRDTGIGIPPDKLSLIFEPFRQVAQGEGPQKGSGLGLSIVRELVHRMGGEVSVETTPGRGSAFRVILPHVPTAQEATEATGAIPISRPKARRILIIEDDEHSRYGLRCVLEMEGYSAHEAGSATEARSQLASGSFDAVFMDISLPDADGEDLIRELRSRPDGAEVPILALTGKTSDEDRRRVERAGASAYLSKPVDVKKMLRTLSRLVETPATAGRH